ncbi:F-box/kelch-repeat protein At3g23880 [Quercus suber]|uniref:F-box/kelch-repeat protein At3g23880 n=1 Tax=Quercus suber TaxID=58331 RepID=UPI000CE24501|nr:F-box/kelch-repeat protein At3g23880-like [Quercus suber]POE61309.1 f-box/kelch-repeat protein [Quercus suber]
MSQTREPPHPRRIFRQKKDHLPHDIVLIILARLPVKSVLRFRCVSKTWYSSIATPNFISNHLIYHKNNNNNNLAYLISIPPLNINIPIFIGGYDDAFNRISEYPIPSGFFPPLYSYPADSCHGLVCFTNHNNLPANTGAIYLWNPSIRKLKRLPAFSQTQYLRFCTGFAYQSNTNDYKVVKISQMPADHNGIKTEAEVYTLSSNSWRRVEISLANTILGVPIDNRRTATFVSGALHWLGNVSEGASLFMILSFDVNNDKFGEIALPHVQQQQLLPQGVMAKINRLMVFKGKLAFITLGYLRFDHANEDEYNDFMSSHTPHSCFIWVMGDYGVHESWSKLFFVQFENVISVRFFGCASRGELLVIKKHNHESNNERRSFTVVSLDLETSREKDLGFQKVPDIATTFMESLVLLDGATELSG